ncbi:MAG TPA: protein kinase [Gemmataceae bacterium]|nr:protein kinase [Gemmataceae bacterium]
MKRHTGDAAGCGGESNLPRQIGSFQIRARLGSGAFGTVYRAFDYRLEREIALKVPQAGRLDTPDRVKRFMREARAAARLRHPHIVAVYEAGQDGNDYFIASAFIAGKTLQAACAEKPLDFDEAAKVVHDLAEALAYAHGEGIVHRDVKPANVMLDDKAHPYLMDFGLALRIDDADRLTHDGAILGTPAYMSPEQAAGKSAQAKSASDQYSLAVILYELLCGQRPFAGSPESVMFHTVHTEPTPPRAIKPAVPRDLETICLKAMAKSPEDRYPNCQALADDLRRWSEGEPIQARRLGLVERVSRWCRREPALVTAGSIVLLCLAAVALIAWLSWINVAAAAERESAARIEAERLNQRVKELLRAGRLDEVFAYLDLAPLPAGKQPLAEEKEDRKPKEGPEAAEVQQLVMKAKQALADGKVQAAEEHLLNALALRPKEPRPLITLLAEVKDRLLRAAREEQRQDDLKAFARKQKLDQQADFKDRIKNGQKKLEAGKFEEALKDYAVAEQSAPNMEGQTSAAKGWDQARSGYLDEQLKKVIATVDSDVLALLKLQELKTQADFYVGKEIIYEQPKEAIGLYQRIMNQGLPSQLSPQILSAFRVIQMESENKLQKVSKLMKLRQNNYYGAMESAKNAMSKGKFDKRQFSIAFEWYVKALGMAPSRETYFAARTGRDTAMAAYINGLELEIQALAARLRGKK